MQRQPEILYYGRNNRGYQLGTGICSGWEMVNVWIKNWNPELLNMNLEQIIKILTPISFERFLCSQCGKLLLGVSVPAPVSIIIFICENGHKFCYENTD